MAEEYLAQVEGDPRPGALRQLRDGVELDDGTTAPAKVSSPGPGLLKLTIHEGRDRQVRRMCDAVGHPVVRLVRTAHSGRSATRGWTRGSERELTQDEVRSLERAVADGPGTSSGDADGDR